MIKVEEMEVQESAVVERKPIYVNDSTQTVEGIDRTIGKIRHSSVKFQKPLELAQEAQATKKKKKGFFAKLC